MIYLFTNRIGGMRFIDVFAAFCARHQCHGTVVFSSRNWQKLRWHRHLKHVLGHYWAASRLRRRTCFDALVVEDINRPEFIQSIESQDIGLVGGFDQIFGHELIGRFASLVNLHTSLLPYYRGPIPTWWVLHNDETHTGLTLHRVTEAIDVGEILFQKVMEILPGETEPELRDRLWQEGQTVLEQWLHHEVLGAKFATKQEDADSIYRVKADYCSYP